MPVVRSQLEGLAEGHRIAVKVEILVDGNVEGQLLDTSGEVITGGGVSYNAGAAFRALLDLSIASEELAPYGPTSELAPYGVELAAYRGLYIAGVPYLNPLGVFKVQKAANNGAGLTAITAPDRGLIVSEAKLEEAINFPAGTQAASAIRTLVSTGYPGAIFSNNFVDIDVPLPALFCDVGEDPWDDALGIAASIGCQLYFDDVGEVALEMVPISLAGNAVATIGEGPGGVLLSAQRDIDRDGINNRIYVNGQNSTTDALYEGVATDTNPQSPTYYDSPTFGHKPDWWESEYIGSNEQAQTAAEGILSRRVGVPDSVSIEALVDPSRRPWDIVRIERERLHLAEEHCLDSLTIPLTRDGTMPASTRATLETEL